MKKPPLRIIVPIIAAVLVATTVLLVISWQLHITADRLRRSSDTATVRQQVGFSNDPVTADDGDVVLLHLRQGDLAALAGDWKAAQDEYASAVQLGGGIPALRKLAQAQMQRRDTDAVKLTIDRLRDAGARDEDLLLLRVIVALRTGELVQATSLLDDAADSPHRHYGQALLLLIQGKHLEARAEFKAVAAGWDPTLRAYARTLDAAYDEFAVFPQGQSIHQTTLLARALAQVQECELALPLLSQVVGQATDYRDAWIVQGYCELTTERLQEALASFERAYQLDPEKPEIQYFLGRAYGALDDHANAVTFLEYALENGFMPQKEVRLRLGQAALESGDASLALDQYAALLALPDAEPESVERAVTLAISLDRKEDAYVHASTAVTRWPEEAKVQELLGWAAQETGRKDEARVALTRAVDLDPTLASARERLSKL